MIDLFVYINLRPIIFMQKCKHMFHCGSYLYHGADIFNLKELKPNIKRRITEENFFRAMSLDCTLLRWKLRSCKSGFRKYRY